MRIIFLIIPLLLSISSFAQGFQAQDQAWYQQLLAAYSSRENIPSVVFGVVDTSGLILTETLGHPQWGATATVTAQSQYQIGSLSKLFTGIIIKNLIQEGQLDPEQPFVKYLGKEISNETQQRWADIRLIDLLHHRAGLPNHGPSTPPTPNGTAMRGSYTAKQLLADLEGIPFRKEALEQPSYSNYGYALLGYIAELVSQKRYADLLDFYVSTPYQLPQTTSQEQEVQQLVTPYFIGKRDKATQYWQMGAETPAGGIFSTLQDLARLQAAQLQAYQTTDRQHPLWLTCQTRPFDQGGYMRYGFGLMETRSFFDSTYVKYEHSGDLDGFASQYKFFPDLGVGYILLTSSGGPWFNELDAMIEQKIIDAPIRDIKEMDKKALKSYTGRYRFDSGFEFEIVRDQEQLKVLFPGNDPVNIYPASAKLLFFRHMNVQIQFEMGSKGDIQKVSYIQNGTQFYPKKVK